MVKPPVGFGSIPVFVVAIVLAGAALVGVSIDSARAAAVTTEGVGPAGAGKAACKAQGTDEARRKALVKRITSLMGGYDAARHDRLLPDATRFVRAEKVRRVQFRDNGLCRVTASFRFDNRAIKEAIKASAQGGGRIGLVVRYIVDGQLAQDAGYNPLEPVRALQRELSKYNCRLVNLLFEQDQFARRMQEKMLPLTGNENEPEALYERGLSHAEAVRNALTAFRQELQRQLGFGKEGFDHAVSGEVVIRHRGQDPDSENKIASALVTLTLHDVATKNPLAPTRPIPVRAPGVDRQTARTLALTAGIESAVAELNRESAICGG